MNAAPRSLRTFAPDDLAGFADCCTRCEPCIVSGLAASWPAASRWAPSGGGIEYLRSAVGSQRAAVMLSDSAEFDGAMRSHTPVEAPVAALLQMAAHAADAAARALPAAQAARDAHADPSAARERSPDAAAAPGRGRSHVYLAQAPLWDDDGGRTALGGALLGDLVTPEHVPRGALAAVCLWLSVQPTECSPHYDPNHNLLCCVAGAKSLRLWPPAAMAAFGPRSPGGEESNHATARARRGSPLDAQAVRAEIKAGDAVFIPEGWWHAVASSGPCTIAVNFWWRSPFGAGLGTDMDWYYMRRAAESLVAQRRLRRLADAPRARLPGPEPLREAAAVAALQRGAAGALQGAGGAGGAEGDPAAVLAALSAGSLRRVLCALAEQDPPSLRALVFDSLSPLGAELLTSKLEEADLAEQSEDPQIRRSVSRDPPADTGPPVPAPAALAEGAPEGGGGGAWAPAFYELFYCALGDERAALTRLIELKEELAAELLREVAADALGLKPAP